MYKYIIKNNIRVLRFHKDEMTQQALAEQAGVSRQTIVAIEKGKYSPSLDLAFRISDVFSLPLEEIFTYEVVEETNKHSIKGKKEKK